MAEGKLEALCVRIPRGATSPGSEGVRAKGMQLKGDMPTMRTTYMAKPREVSRTWYVVDAEGKPWVDWLRK